MRAAVLKCPGEPLTILDVPQPSVTEGNVLLRVRACGVCRTDLHITEGDLPQRVKNLIPGHQIVGEVVAGEAQHLGVGTRVGVSWIGGTDSTCWFCTHGHENLCDAPEFTGYTRHGGY